MKPTLVRSVDGIEVWHGDCLDPATVELVLQGRRADLLHVDAPYSARTHDAHGRSGDDVAGLSRPSKAPAPVPYAGWSGEDVAKMCGNWVEHVAGWATTITDHTLAPFWENEFGLSDRYVFAPLPWVETGSRIRLAGDGPSSWTCWAIVARPRHAPYAKWGTLRGAYIYPAERRDGRIIGGKHLRGTCEFISDYSRRGDLVLDPCLGGGTTAIASRMTGRRCIGIEKDEGRAELCARLIGNAREQMALLV